MPRYSLRTLLILLAIEMAMAVAIILLAWASGIVAAIAVVVAVYALWSRRDAVLLASKRLQPAAGEKPDETPGEPNVWPEIIEFQRLCLRLVDSVYRPRLWAVSLILLAYVVSFGPACWMTSQQATHYPYKPHPIMYFYWPLGAMAAKAKSPHGLLHRWMTLGLRPSHSVFIQTAFDGSTYLAAWRGGFSRRRANDRPWHTLPRNLPYSR